MHRGEHENIIMRAGKPVKIMFKDSSLIFFGYLRKFLRC